MSKRSDKSSRHRVRNDIDHRVVLLKSLEEASTWLRQAELAAIKLGELPTARYLRKEQSMNAIIYRRHGGEAH